VLILNGVKVICFHTLLQVLILKVVKVAVSVFLQPFAKCAPFEALGKPLEARGKQESLAASKLDLPDFKGLDFSRGEPSQLWVNKRPQENEGKGDSS
jgi:hypothetical protein